MKRFLQAGVALALIAGTGGCVDLNEKLVSSLGSPYVATAQGLTDATNAMYQSLRTYGFGDTYYAMEDLGTDTWMAADQVSAGGAQNWIYLETYGPAYTSLNGFVDAEWNAAYTLISRANVVLDNGPNTPVGGTLTQGVKDARLGEAHWMRAWAYFQLVQQFGGVTVNLHAASGVTTEAKRETEDSVYKVILDDVNQAVTMLPTSQSDYGRVTRYAALHLRSKVYLTRAYASWNTANKQADFQKALDDANAVINSGQYSLVPVFADLWCGTHRAAAPADPGRQGFCDLTNYSEQNKEVILPVQFSYLTSQYNGGAEANYQHLVFLSRYDANSDWAAGMVRDLDNGRPFRRVRATPEGIALFNQTRYAGTPTPGAAEVLDTRFDGSFQTVYFANGNGNNGAGTCPKCTSGQPVTGTLLKDAGGSAIGAAAGSDTSLVYIGYQVPDSYRQSKKYRIAVPCTTDPTQDCGNDNDAKGMYGFMHYPSLKKYQDNLRLGGLSDANGGKDMFRYRLGETYLLKAEAAVGLGQNQVAADAINVLRVRAACDPATSVKLCTTSHKADPAIMVTAGQMNINFIMDEREREMAGEFTRWQDLHRPGKDFFLTRIKQFSPAARPNLQDKHYYKPIPQRQINGVTGTPYPQNPGW